MAHPSPFEVLRTLERRALAHGAELPSQEEYREEWVGVGFRLAGRELITPMEHVVELLKPPEMAPVPRTRPWVRGMANVRGTLLPVMDLNGFLGMEGSSAGHASRVLVVPIENAYTGVLVDEVLGLRHFPMESVRAAPRDVDGRYAGYVTGRVVHGGDNWLVFSMEALAADPRFLQVAA